MSDDDDFGVAIPLPPELIERIMRRGKGKSRSKPETTGTHIAAQIMDLQGAFMAYQQPETFNVGDLVTERDSLGMITSGPAVLMIFRLLSVHAPYDRDLIGSAHETHAFIEPDCMVAYRSEGSTYVVPHETWRLQPCVGEAAP